MNDTVMKLSRFAAALGLMLTAITSFAAEKLVYVLSLGEEIGPITWLYTRDALAEARERRADLFVLDLNTYGGAVQDADSIRTALLRCPIPTVAYIDHNAASAGALIALSCDSVYMSPGSSMGAATVVNGAGEAMPDKYQSYMRSLMRSTAEAHGKYFDKSDSTMQWRRDPLIAEAMVDHRVIVPGLIDSTKVLTFTPEEALKWNYSDGTCTSLSQVLDKLGYSGAEIERYTPTLTNKLLGFLSSAVVQGVLIMLIIGGIVMEIKTPGLGFPAAAALIAAVLYFLPMCVTGVVSGWVILVFIAGIVLLALEVFVIPGFGVAGIAGVIGISGSIIMALVQKESIVGVTLHDVAYACMIFMIALVVAIAIAWWLSSKFSPRFVRAGIELERAQLIADGYVGVDMAPAAKVGAKGVTVTDMRPSGKVLIDGEVYDAVAISGFVESGTEVTVAKYENSQIYVK